MKFRAKSEKHITDGLFVSDDSTQDIDFTISDFFIDWKVDFEQREYGIKSINKYVIDYRFEIAHVSEEDGEVVAETIIDKNSGYTLVYGYETDDHEVIAINEVNIYLDDKVIEIIF